MKIKKEKITKMSKYIKYSIDEITYLGCFIRIFNNLYEDGSYNLHPSDMANFAYLIKDKVTKLQKNMLKMGTYWEFKVLNKSN